MRSTGMRVITGSADKSDVIENKANLGLGKPKNCARLCLLAEKWQGGKTVRDSPQPIAVGDTGDGSSLQ
jgi:hypothetical protein